MGQDTVWPPNEGVTADSHWMGIDSRLSEKRGRTQQFLVWFEQPKLNKLQRLSHIRVLYNMRLSVLPG